MNKIEMKNFLVKNGVDENEAGVEIELILECLFNKTREELIFEKDFDEKKVLPILEKRVKNFEPIQYILGFSYFMGERFFVNENVLIPRDETEILVLETVKSAYKKIKNPISPIKILDIGIGSGIISCMAAKILNEKKIKSEILGVDISNKAILTAEKNREKFNLKNVKFIESNLFSNVSGKFDIIVSNPPYIPIKMRENIQREVRFEPDLALYANDDKGLYFYKKIIEESKNFLNKDGTILFEIMDGQAEDVFRILENENFKEIELIPDMAQILRVIKGENI